MYKLCILESEVHPSKFVCPFFGNPTFEESVVDSRCYFTPRNYVLYLYFTLFINIFAVLIIEFVLVSVMQGKSLEDSMFVQSLRGDPFRVSSAFSRRYGFLCLKF